MKYDRKLILNTLYGGIFMAIKSHFVFPPNSYTPVAEELEKWLKIIQSEWNYKVISIHETKYNKPPDHKSDQAFIIIYDDMK